jgi:gas vesicle protein
MSIWSISVFFGIITGIIIGFILGTLTAFSISANFRGTYNTTYDDLYDHNGSALSIPAYQKYVIDRQAEELKEKIK